MKLLSTKTAAPVDRGRAPALKLESFLPYRLVVIASQVSEMLSGIYAERYGFGIPEWRVIATLGQFGTMTAKAVGAHSHMDKTKVSRAVTELARRRYLRSEVNREDRRETFLTLTPRGRAIYEDIAPVAIAFADHLFDGTAAADRAAFERVLTSLTGRTASGSKRKRASRR